MKILKDWLKYLVPFTLGVFIFAYITQYETTTAMVNSLFNEGMYLVSRFIIAFGVAYFLNFPMRFFERRFKLKRPISITITYIVAICVVALLIWFVVPSLVDSVRQILSTSQTYYIQVQELIEGASILLPESAQSTVNDILESLSTGIMAYLTRFVSMDYLGSILSKAVSNSVRTFLNIFFGLFISFYALWYKEKVAALMKAIVNALLPEIRAQKTLALCKDADHNFSLYLIGKIWGSLIIGAVSLIAFIIFGVPVPAFLAFVSAITNMIPYFGPLAGNIITGIVLLGFGPKEMITGMLIAVAVQTLDGAVVEPKILGSATGVNPLLVIISITIGGDLFGIPGMFLAVPIVSTVQHLVMDRLKLAPVSDKPDEPPPDKPKKQKKGRDA